MGDGTRVAVLPTVQITPSKDSTWHAVGVRALFATAVMAFTARMLTTLAVADATLFSDMAEYHGRAEILLRDGFFNFDSWRGPGYPLLLAALYALPGPDLLTARIANALMGGATAALTAVLASRFVPREAALAAGAVVALYPALVLSSVYIMPEGLYAVLLVATLVTAERSAPLRGVIAGALAGVAALTRALGIALVPAVVAGNLLSAWRHGDWRRAWATNGLLVVSCVLTITPWFIHTTRVSGGVMLDSASPYNMLVGSNPRATGRLELQDVGWIFETYLVGSQNEAERNSRALQASWQWIKSEPTAWLRLVPIKIGYLWGLEGREHIWLYANSYFGQRGATTVWSWGLLMLVSFPLLAIAAVVGMFRPGLTSHHTGWYVLLLLGLVTALHASSFGESRFHLPLIPVLAPLAVRGVAGHEPFTRPRIVACGVVLAALATAWVTQAPELIERLLRLAGPGGSTSALTY